MRAARELKKNRLPAETGFGTILSAIALAGKPNRHNLPILLKGGCS
jgi:hypothetical protein